MKFGRTILEVWHQDGFSREKVKLGEHSGKLAYCKTSWGWVESCGSGFKQKNIPKMKIADIILQS